MEVDYDIISGQNVKAIEGYIGVNFEVDSSSSYRKFLKGSFCDSEAGDGSGDLNAICGQKEIPDDVIYGEGVEIERERETSLL